MNALGWTDGSEALPAGFEATIAAEGLVLVTADPEDARARLEGQCLLSRRLQSFVPSAPGTQRALSQTEAGRLKELLQALRGYVQVSLDLHAPEQNSVQPWLRARAARLREQTDMGQQVSALLSELGAVRSLTRLQQGRLRVDGLINRTQMRAFAEALRQGLMARGRAEWSGWTCAVALPLPVFSFANGLADG